MAANLKQWLVRGIKAAKAGDKEQARIYLQRILRSEAPDKYVVEAWFWLAKISDDARQEQTYLQKILQKDPYHKRAKLRLHSLKLREKIEKTAVETPPDSAPPEPPARQPAATDSKQCPHCGREMFFTPDGIALYCDFCNHRQPVKRPRRTPADIALEQNTRRYDPGEKGAFRAANARHLLAQGIAAAKAGDADEAIFYLAWTLRTDSTLQEQAKAWLWLSAVYEEPAEKRECLEQALAIQPNNAKARRELAVLEGRLQADEIVDPDRIAPAPQPGAPQEAQAEQFACPQCSGRMNYTPDGQALLCEFCNYRQELAQEGQPLTEIEERFGMGKLEQDFTVALATARGHLQPVATRSLQCQSCAVEFVVAPQTLSLTCPYCDSVYVTETAETHNIIPPHVLIPFATSEEDAKKIVRAWFKKHKLKPTSISPVVGIYLPAWTFDVGGLVTWRGLVRQGDDWVAASGNKAIFYDDVLVPAGDRLPASLVKKGLRGFDFDKMVAYDSRYLAAWPAERYTLSMADASLKARGKLVRAMRHNPAEITRGRGYVKDLVLNSNGMVIESFKLILLPFWVVHYKQEGEVYEIVLNGQSGQVHGEKPESIAGKLVSWLRGE